MLLLPLITSFLVGSMGRKIGIKGTNFIVIGTLLICSVFTIILSYEVIITGSFLSLEPLVWLDIGNIYLTWGFTLTPLSAWLISTVLIISLLVHIFASSYMSSDPNPQRFMALLLAFTGFMVMLIAGDNLGVLFFGYEGKLYCLKWLSIKNFLKLHINSGNNKEFNIQKKCFHTKIKIPSTSRIGPHNKDVLSLIIASLLGDTHMEKRKNEKGSRLIVEQCGNNVEYLMWLHQFFAKRGYCSITKPKLKRRIRKNNKVYFHYRFTTFAFSSFNWIHDSFYSLELNSLNFKKIIPLNFLEKYMDNMSLAIWFMDDGSLQGSGFKICTSGFEYTEIIKFKSLLENKFKLNCSIHKDRNYWNIYIKKESCPLFASIVYPYMLPSMRYKLGNYSLDVYKN